MSLVERGTGPLRAVLGNRDLVLLVTAGLVASTGSWVLRTALAFQVYALTGSPAASAGALLAGLVPQILLGPVAGALADRVDRRRLLVGADLLLGVVLLPLPFAGDGAAIGVVLAVLTAASALAPFVAAAEAALLPALVGPAERVPANALNGQARDLSRLIGAALGGVLVAAGGLPAVTAAEVVAVVVAAALVLAARRRPAPTDHDQASGGGLRGGAAAVRRSRPLRVVLILFALTGFGEGIMGSLFAPFVQDVLHASAAAYGAILAVQSVGGIAGGAVLTAVGARIDPRALIGWGALLFGALDTALFLVPPALPGPVPAAVLIVLVGLPGAALTAGLLSVFQAETEPASRGRVFGLLTAGQSATMLVGAVMAATATDALGIVPVLVAQGAVYLIGGAIALPALRPAPVATPLSAPA